jgi:hypothetical protein
LVTGRFGVFARQDLSYMVFRKLRGAPMLTFHQKRELHKLIIEQNKVLAGLPAPAERIETERIKREALSKLGIPTGQDQGIQQ